MMRSRSRGGDPPPRYSPNSAFEMDIQEPEDRRRPIRRSLRERFNPTYNSVVPRGDRHWGLRQIYGVLLLLEFVALGFGVGLTTWATRHNIQLTAYACPRETDAYVTCDTTQKLLTVAWSLVAVKGVFWLVKRCIADPEDVRESRINKKQQVALLLLPMVMVGYAVALIYIWTSFVSCPTGCISAEDAYCTKLIDAAGQVVRGLPRSCTNTEALKEDDWEWWQEGH